MMVTINVEQALESNLSSVIEEDLDNRIINKVKSTNSSLITLRTKEDYRKFINDWSIE
jgi:hypothetical protein